MIVSRRILSTNKRLFTTATTLPLTQLTAVSSIDGRYSDKSSELREYFSEYALIKKRVLVEVSWVNFMSQRSLFPEIPSLNNEEVTSLLDIANSFDFEAAQRVKEIEKITNHDVKAVEYYIKEKLTRYPHNSQLNQISEFVHFGCTSEDINNLSYSLIFQEAVNKILEPVLSEVILSLRDKAYEYKDISILSRTHGQSATPSTLGKELSNFALRLARQRKRILQVEFLGKFNGAVGNFAAHRVCDDSIVWPDISKHFVTDLGLTNNPFTTQIEPHDFIGELSDGFGSYNQVLLDCSKDLWGYISLGYFSQKNIKGQIGSSTMPHKTNPIDFENSEGNLELSNALFSFFKRKLTVSRYQRDLSDSTVLRTVGLSLAHSLLAYKSFLGGLKKLDANEEQMKIDLDRNVEVLAEPIQMVLRKYQEDKPYEQLKELTKGKKVGIKDFHDFIEKLNIPLNEKEILLKLRPDNYIGFSVEQVHTLDKELEKVGFNKRN